MLDYDLNLNHIKQDSCEILSNFENKNAVKKIGVFGSFARGDYTKGSDIDLVIDYNYAKTDVVDDVFKFLNFIGEIREMFKSRYNKETDIVEYKALEQKENRLLKQELDREIVWIYEQKQKKRFINSKESTRLSR